MSSEPEIDELKNLQEKVVRASKVLDFEGAKAAAAYKHFKKEEDYSKELYDSLENLRKIISKAEKLEQNIEKSNFNQVTELRELENIYEDLPDNSNRRFRQINRSLETGSHIEDKIIDFPLKEKLEENRQLYTHLISDKYVERYIVKTKASELSEKLETDLFALESILESGEDSKYVDSTAKTVYRKYKDASELIHWSGSDLAELNELDELSRRFEYLAESNNLWRELEQD